MTNREALNAGMGRLKAAGIEEAAIDAFYLFGHITGMSKAAYLLHADEVADNSIVTEFSRLIARREKREPCQYITGLTEFMGLRFNVNPEVLIPRQDTEILCENAIEILKKHYGNGAEVLDLCTGSGALAVSIKKYFSKARVMGSDISPKALETAVFNAKENGTEVAFCKSDLFENIGGSFDMIVSNPPYVTEDEYRMLSPEVRDYEPKTALTAEDGGLWFYGKITSNAGVYLKKGGWLLFEIGCRQGADVKKLMMQNGFTDIEIKNDLAGLQRVVMGKKKGAHEEGNS